MSHQEKQNAIILENIPLLIQSLTGFENHDENFALCENFILSRIRNHKYLSVNSHEIRRQIESLAERFRISNNEKYEKRLHELCDSIIKHPLCIDHFETDIEWSILDFLFSLAYNPVNLLTSFAANDTKYDDRELAMRLARDQKTYWTKLLQIDNIVESDSTASDSELSIWSDSDDECEQKDKSSELHVDTTADIEIKTICLLPGLKPPEKLPHFHVFNSFSSSQWLQNSIQNCWWQNELAIYKVNSVHKAANFGHNWPNNCLGGALTTTSEYCLIREIIWMFLKPTTCKFFQLNGNKIIVNSANNSSINSTSLLGIHSYLNKFCYYMTLMHRLQQFYNNVNESIGHTPPIAYEYFANGIQQYLEPFRQYLIEKEMEIMQPAILNKSMTILQLQIEMATYFQMLEMVFKIFSNCVLDYQLIPAHICTSNLICGLLNEACKASNKNYLNLAASLFLVSMKVYLHVIDIWWTEGRLEDFKNEFMIEKANNSNAFTVRRLSSGDNNKNWPNCNEDLIKNCPLIKLLTSHSIQAGHSLNILSNLDRIGDIKNRSEYQENLYQTFLDLTFEKLLKFKQNESSENIPIGCESQNNELDTQYDDYNGHVMEFRNDLLNVNPILFMVFEDSLNIADGDESIPKKILTDTERKSQINAYEMCEKLNNLTPLMLPFEQIVFKVLTDLLSSRIYVANSCVMTIYKDEFDVLQHVRNLRKVYLFEESDLMYAFYSKLFKQIECGENWNNPYLLNIQLNGILGSKFPGSNSLFTIQVSSKHYKENDVLDAIRGISVNYSVNEGLQDVVNEKCFNQYNEVFRYLLRIKWGLWTLENLRFPQSLKKARPYTKLNITDITFKRLALARNWIIYAIQCIHNHLMIEVLQTMGEKLDQKMQSTQTLNEIIEVHRSYISTVYDYCFQMKNDENIRGAIDQFLILITALRDEWYNICYIKDVLDGELSGDELDNSSVLTGINAIEQTYINCHRVVAAILNAEVYTKNRGHLSGLSAAFNCSHPF